LVAEVLVEKAETTNQCLEENACRHSNRKSAEKEHTKKSYN
jgi:hypothetical protein